MTSRTFLRSAIVLAFTVLMSATVHAQLFRAYLAPYGSDANACTLPAPCRLLPAALAAVASGGEIWMLDSANYNTETVNITKSVTILAVPGALGSVLATGGPAISIATAGVNVALRNLVIVPLPGAGGTTGIFMTNGSGLSVDECLVAGLPSNGIDVRTAARVRIANSVIRNIGNDALQLRGGAITEIVGTKISGTGNFGVNTFSDTAGVTTSTSVTDSTIANAGNCGAFSNIANASALARSFLTRVTSTGNNGGLCVQGGPNALMTITDSTVQGNVYGVVFSTATSVVKSFGNNAISDNTAGDVVGGGALTTTPLR